ncbi:hypothetical protein PUN28_005464 [Cardiocondyla obscurior]|uniref:Uncharacterized protein n=1 Tax=Cardiocondyla obscurior TaxID=286306 RepID=A0AAW2GHQ3_9HYME
MALRVGAKNSASGRRLTFRKCRYIGTRRRRIPAFIVAAFMNRRPGPGSIQSAHVPGVEHLPGREIREEHLGEETGHGNLRRTRLGPPPLELSSRKCRPSGKYRTLSVALSTPLAPSKSETGKYRPRGNSFTNPLNDYTRHVSEKRAEECRIAGHLSRICRAII